MQHNPMRWNQVNANFNDSVGFMRNAIYAVGNAGELLGDMGDDFHTEKQRGIENERNQQQLQLNINKDQREADEVARQLQDDKDAIGLQTIYNNYKSLGFNPVNAGEKALLEHPEVSHRAYKAFYDLINKDMGIDLNKAKLNESIRHNRATEGLTAASLKQQAENNKIINLFRQAKLDFDYKKFNSEQKEKNSLVNRYTSAMKSINEDIDEDTIKTLTKFESKLASSESNNTKKLLEGISNSKKTINGVISGSYFDSNWIRDDETVQAINALDKGVWHPVAGELITKAIDIQNGIPNPTQIKYLVENREYLDNDSPFKTDAFWETIVNNPKLDKDLRVYIAKQLNNKAKEEAEKLKAFERYGKQLLDISTDLDDYLY